MTHDPNHSAANEKQEFDVIVIGAGLSGLTCGVELARQGKRFKILEATDAAGGRVRTDLVDGFRCDRGFQVFLTAYPDAKRMLDYDSLEFRKFKSGAIIRFDGDFCRISDVVKHPGDLPGNLFSKAASIADKLKIASLRREVGRQSIDEIGQSENMTTRQRLEKFGFSEKIIGSFFRPFFGGVFLEPELVTSRRMFDFVFKMFAEGDVVIPSNGMQEISRQLASRLPADCLELNCRVCRVANHAVETEDGRTLSAKNIIVAIDEASLSTLNSQPSSNGNGVTCIYFKAEKSPIREPILVLNGDETDGPINNLCVPSDVSSNYAPDGQSLISVTVLGVGHGEELMGRVRDQLRNWYGPQTDHWQQLKTYEIPYALPTQDCQHLEVVDKPLTTENGVIYCGDYLSFASIQGAMATGRRSAQSVS